MRKLLLLLVITLVGCREKVSEEEAFYLKFYEGYDDFVSATVKVAETTISDDFITIDIPHLGDKLIGVDLDMLVDSMYYIHLETKENVLLGDVDRVLLAENRIITLEIFSRNVAYMFDREGNFISQIGDPGEGPEEYQSFADLAIDHKHKEIVMVDDRGEKRLYFDFEGSLLRTERMYFVVRNLTIFDDGGLLLEQTATANRHVEVLRNHMLYFTDRDGIVQQYGILRSYPQTHTLRV